ncbi:MAG: tRNA glutamyl-Q(34) synthetase GluQRS [Polyangiaceae bacterium]
MNSKKIVTRFAPSPTGDLHLGGAIVALASWWMARQSGGRFVVRMEDIDTPRIVQGAAENILDDLAWLGLAWDGDVTFQSARTKKYLDALETLTARGLVYMCDCSRAELAKIASAPHEGEEVVYPGLCASLSPTREMKRQPALRVRVPYGTLGNISFVDEIHGSYTQNLSQNVGDFVIRRSDDVFSYQLVVTVDDLDQEVTHVIRGADLLSSTPRQIYLARELGHEPPTYAHVPLVLDASGERIAKRSGFAHIRALREKGISRDEILGALTHALGLAPTDAPLTPAALASISPSVQEGGWRKTSWTPPAHWQL